MLVSPYLIPRVAGDLPRPARRVPRPRRQRLCRLRRRLHRTERFLEAEARDPRPALDLHPKAAAIPRALLRNRTGPGSSPTSQRTPTQASAMSATWHRWHQAIVTPRELPALALPHRPTAPRSEFASVRVGGDTTAPYRSRDSSANARTAVVTRVTTSLSAPSTSAKYARASP